MDLIAALRLQQEWGADESLAERPQDRTAAPAPVAPPHRPALAISAPSSSVARAQALAAAAQTIDQLRQAMAGFSDFPLAATATNLVFADGNPQSGLVLIGESPGPEEDLSGKPFAGPAGQFLDRMLAAIGLSRANALLTNLIPWRPPGNRPPSETEIQTCLPFLQRHLHLLQPTLIITLGALPVRALAGRDDPIRRLRGRWLHVPVPSLPQPVPTLPMLHPAYIMQNSAAKRETWADLLTVRRHLNTV